ncbi:MAG: 3-hydroxyacyl-CoA dehydrogenase NAD-binding domain-containing protein [Elusimicrobiota bacterium]|nr:3-hydroxyacyl-CoA dehydrogenase NAD-binding domain-containing protein [Elusimicrobiota bacterium]
MISRVGVVGAGVMGGGIAQLCAQAGFSVKLHDPVPAALEAFPGKLRKALDAATLRGRLTTAQADRAFMNLTLAPRLEDLDGADLVIEAAPEALALKQELFRRLSVVCPDAILATNTSSLSVAAIMKDATLPVRTLGVHFFNPPVAMKLVELVRWKETGQEAFKEAWDFVLMGLRRTPVDVKDVPGFIVNRVMRPYYLTGQRLATAGTGFAGVDEACRAAGGVPMGPFELMDLIGLDTNFAITTVIYEALGRPARFAPPALQKALVERGAVGRKSGRGFYLYADGKPAGENPDALALLPPGAAPAPAALWAAVRDELVAEAALVASEGTAGPGDIDTAIKLAMNFPKGPFEWRRENTAA